MFLHAFEQSIDVILVLSDARIVDVKGEIVAESFYKKRGAFVPGVLSNIFKNKYLGCAMAFRKSLIDKILPFPTDIPMHDMWIGIISATCGKQYFINTPLIDYRRHERNASPDKRRGLVQMLVWRWSMIKNMCLRLITLSMMVLQKTEQWI